MTSGIINKCSFWIKFASSLTFLSLILLPIQTFALTANGTQTSNNSYFSTVASNSPSASQLCVGVSEISGVPCSQQSATSQSTTNSLIHNVILILSYVLGVIAVIMVIIGGFLFTTSGGDSKKVTTAKSTIIYALVGLAVAVLAQILVRWVIGTSSNLSSGGVVLFLHLLY